MLSALVLQSHLEIQLCTKELGISMLPACFSCPPPQAGNSIPIPFHSQPEKDRVEQTSSCSLAECFPCSALPIGSFRLLYHERPIDLPFQREIFPLFSSQSFPPFWTHNFSMHYIRVWNSSENQDSDPFFQRLDEGAFSASGAGWQLFCFPRSGNKKAAWKHGLIESENGLGWKGP